MSSCNNLSGEEGSNPFRAPVLPPLTPEQIRCIAQAVNGGTVRGAIIRLASEMSVTRQTIDYWLAKKHPPSVRLGRMLRQLADDYSVDLNQIEV